MLINTTIANLVRTAEVKTASLASPTSGNSLVMALAELAKLFSGTKGS